MSESHSNRSDAGRPTLCRKCGSIVGAGEPQCAVCGASTTTAPAPRQRAYSDRETIRFARAILDRPYKFTIIILIANLFVFLLMWESSGLTTGFLWQGFPDAVLIAYGAKLNMLIKAPHHEWWRLVTPMFVHVNLIHILVNMYSLWIVGPFVEKLYGSAKFTVFWVVTGIAGVLGSYLTVRPNLAVNALARFIFKSQDAASAGASGALFGLVGVLFVFGIKYRHELPEGFKRAFGTGLLPIILINLFIGYLGRGFIDNAAHLGGLVSGSLLALVVHYRRPGESRGVTTAWRVLQIAALSLVVFSFFKIVQRLPTYLSPPQPVVQKTSSFLSYINAMNQAQETVNIAIYDGDISNMDAAVKNLSAVVPPDPKAGELRDRLVNIMAKLAAPIANATPESGPRRPQKPDTKVLEEFKSWSNEYDQWLKTQTHSTSTPE